MSSRYNHKKAEAYWQELWDQKKIFNAKTDKNKNKYLDDVKIVTNKIIGCDGLILCGPEYNGSITPIINNSIAWISMSTDYWRDAFLNKIEEYKNKFRDQNNVPRPKYWSGFLLSPKRIEFWKDVEGRLHQRLEYSKHLDSWKKQILYP